VKEMKETKVPENKAYKVTLILLVGLAAFSTAVKDLNRLQEMVSSFQEFTSQWRGTDLVTLNDKPISTSESCPKDGMQRINFSAESGLSDGVALVRGIEIERIDYETIDEPEVGGKVEPVGSKKVNRKVPPLARAKYAPARNLKKVEISAMRRDGHWPARFEYKTFDRTISLDLPMTMVTDFKADALETEVSPTFPLNLLGRLSRKQPHGKTDNGRREFMLKRFERINNSRRAS
jgi:hypothetical protein